MSIYRYYKLLYDKSDQICHLVAFHSFYCPTFLSAYITFNKNTGVFEKSHKSTQLCKNPLYNGTLLICCTSNTTEFDKFTVIKCTLCRQRKVLYTDCILIQPILPEHFR